MGEWLADQYLWLKALHLISVIAWMAGLLYLPRLFVYHADTTPGSEQSETFKIMERRLLRAIMNPAGLLSMAFGALLLWVLSPGIWESGWVYVKLACVVGLIVSHEIMARHQRLFARDENQKPTRYFRILNEVPTVLMIVIVIMVIVQPF